MVGTTAFQNGSCQRATGDSKLAVGSERFEKRQLRLPQSKCRTHRRVSVGTRQTVAVEHDPTLRQCSSRGDFSGDGDKWDIVVPFFTAVLGRVW